ncbi:MAG: FHA domain-containing protein [Sporichthyaceae bacterium]|nr:FHA domain-containing protein [Sporichthyaceae bacterium]
MSELTLTLIRLGFLAVLWMFVLTAISVMRSDIFGTRAVQRRAAQPRGKAAPRPAAKPAKVKKGVPGKVVVTAGGQSGVSVPLGSTPVTIGRAQGSTIVLDDDYASGQHARLVPGLDGQWMVEDLRSTNGTYLDGRKIASPTAVAIGNKIRIGKTVIELRK